MRRLMLKERTEEINSKLLEGENHTTYPFGDDRFYISHGDDYFKFFPAFSYSKHIYQYCQLDNYRAMFFGLISMKNTLKFRLS